MVLQAPEAVVAHDPGSPLEYVCRHRHSTRLARLIITMWPIPLAVATPDRRGVIELLLEGLYRTKDVYLVPSDLLALVERATRRLLLAMVELVFHETACDEVAVPVRADLTTVLRTQLTTAEWASKSTNSLALMRSLRMADCPAELCCRAFRLPSVQQLMLSADTGPFRAVLDDLYRLHRWEDGGVAEDDMKEEEEDLPTPPDPARLVELSQIDALVPVNDSLDILFLRLRESPALFHHHRRRRLPTRPSADASTAAAAATTTTTHPHRANGRRRPQKLRREGNTRPEDDLAAHSVASPDLILRRKTLFDSVTTYFVAERVIVKSR